MNRLKMQPRPFYIKKLREPYESLLKFYCGVDPYLSLMYVPFWVAELFLFCDSRGRDALQPACVF